MAERSPAPHAASQGSPDSGIIDAIEQSSDGYYELDRTFRYRRVNAAGARLAGLPRDQILGKTVLELFPDVETSAVHAAVQRAMAGGLAESVEMFYGPLGIWAVNDVFPIPQGVAIFSRDVTRQRSLERNLSFLARAGKALNETLDVHETLQTVASLATPHIADWCAVDMLDEDGKIELVALAHVNPERVAWARELRAQSPPDRNAPNGLPRVLRTGRPELIPEITDEMIVAAAKDAEHLALIRGIGFSSVMIVPLVSRGNVIGAMSFVSAESKRTYADADLAMAEELASRAARAIENSRLYESAQRAIAVRDDFIYAASHELRTPVTSLKLYAEVLQRHARRGDVDQISRNLAKMDAQIDKLAVLIGDLLDVSKIAAGKLEFRDEEVDVNALVLDVIDAVQPTFPKHRIELEGAATPPIRGDRDRLGQVVTNLLTNAAKYSPGADRVVVRIYERDAGLALEVEDFGIGIDEEHLDRIFDRFYRVTSADEKTFPGLGIGLYISQQIMRRHGGSLAVSSTRGKGSVFRILAPRYGQSTETAETEP